MTRRIPAPTFRPSLQGSSYPIWLMAKWHPPERGSIHSVKIGVKGHRFTGYFDYDRKWHQLNNDADAHGARTLGDPIDDIDELYFVEMVKDD